MLLGILAVSTGCTGARGPRADGGAQKAAGVRILGDQVLQYRTHEESGTFWVTDAIVNRSDYDPRWMYQLLVETGRQAPHDAVLGALLMTVNKDGTAVEHYYVWNRASVPLGMSWGDIRGKELQGMSGKRTQPSLKAGGPLTVVVRQPNVTEQFVTAVAAGRTAPLPESAKVVPR